MSFKRSTSAGAVSPIFWFFAVTAASNADAATRYVCGSVSACNTNNTVGGSSEWSGTPANSGKCTSTNNPCKTIRYGLSVMAPTDTLIIGNGTYQGLGTTANKNLDGNIIGSVPNNPPQNKALDLTAISGMASTYTVIKAENDWGVIIDSQNQSQPAWLKINYAIIRGIQFLNSIQVGLRLDQSDHVKVLRCAAQEQIAFGIALCGTPGADASSGGVGSTNCLVEECVAFGAGTYFFEDNNYNGPGANNIFRHNLVRRDAYSMADNHYRSYQVYDAPSTNTYFQNNLSVDGVPVMNANSLSSNTSITLSPSLVGTTLKFAIRCSNPIVGCGSDWFSVDQIPVYVQSTTNPTTDWIYASATTAYSIDANGNTGSLTVQVAAVSGSGTISTWAIGRPYQEEVISQDNASGGVNVTGLLAINDDNDVMADYSSGSDPTAWVITHSAFYLTHSIVPRGGLSSGYGDTITNCLVTGATDLVDQTGIGFWESNGDPKNMKNNIAYGNWRGFQDNPGGSALINEGYNDAYGNSATDYSNYTPATTDLTIDPLTNGLMYPTRIEVGSVLATAGSGGGQIGPSIIYRYGPPGTATTCGGPPDGMSCTTYGDPGWNQLQDGQNGAGTANLWPWPNEAVIANLMCSYQGHGISGNRGFCTYQSPFGSPNSLTSYIWEYLGHKIPANVYAGQVYTGPSGSGGLRSDAGTMGTGGIVGAGGSRNAGGTSGSGGVRDDAGAAGAGGSPGCACTIGHSHGKGNAHGFGWAVTLLGLLVPLGREAGHGVGRSRRTWC